VRGAENVCRRAGQTFSSGVFRIPDLQRFIAPEKQQAGNLRVRTAVGDQTHPPTSSPAHPPVPQRL